MADLSSETGFNGDGGNARVTKSMVFMAEAEQVFSMHL